MSVRLPDSLDNMFEARSIVTKMDGEHLRSRTSLIIVTFSYKLQVAAACLLVWDYLITLDLEVNLVWRSRMSYLKIIYLIQRYLPLLDTVYLGIRNSVMFNPRADACAITVISQSVLMLVGMMSSEVILTKRTWAAWDCKPAVGYSLFVLYVACWGTSAGLLVNFLSSIRYADAPHPMFQGCALTGVRLPAFVGWTVMFCWDAPLSVVNMVIAIALPIEYQPLLNSTIRCLHAVFASRTLLHIRLTSVANSPHSASTVTGPLEITGGQFGLASQVDIRFARPSELDENDVPS
ncbi:hypothetical protein CVT24_000800 [Panaeolus cyanescens]|uniref:DUF6533 domain-containing protein n=1 Tax=Panaeolus cyanescens TaxID=181874 RepID=A0A409YCK3_9AGAR|nr:hypothetical protein CVT24_000800 [Panaeolus cyanescens]